jgi:hypothetical protein
MTQWRIWRCVGESGVRGTGYEVRGTSCGHGAWSTGHRPWSAGVSLAAEGMLYPARREDDLASVRRSRTCKRRDERKRTEDCCRGLKTCRLGVGCWVLGAAKKHVSRSMFHVACSRFQVQRVAPPAFGRQASGRKNQICPVRLGSAQPY